jgi:hypothetical protein
MSLGWIAKSPLASGSDIVFFPAQPNISKTHVLICAFISLSTLIGDGPSLIASFQIYQIHPD